MKACLLVIDLIEDFLAPLPPERVARLISHVNTLAAVVRARSGSIIWVRQEFEPDLSDAFLEMRDRNIRVAVRGTSGARLDPRLNRAEGDFELVKKRYSAFFGGELDGMLAELQPTQLILAGVNTHACVRMTAIDAYQRDFRVILASDCLDSYDVAHGRMSLHYMDGKIARAQTNAEIGEMLGG